VNQHAATKSLAEREVSVAQDNAQPEVSCLVYCRHLKGIPGICSQAFLARPVIRFIEARAGYENFKQKLSLFYLRGDLVSLLQLRNAPRLKSSQSPIECTQSTTYLIVLAPP